jgi:hypothetical protein
MAYVHVSAYTLFFLPNGGPSRVLQGPLHADLLARARPTAKQVPQSLQKRAISGGGGAAERARREHVPPQAARGPARTWDALVQHDGLRAASALVDARTDLECVPRRRPRASFTTEREWTVTR